MIPNSPCKVGLATPQDVEAGPERCVSSAKRVVWPSSERRCEDGDLMGVVGTLGSTPLLLHWTAAPTYLPGSNYTLRVRLENNNTTANPSASVPDAGTRTLLLPRTVGQQQQPGCVSLLMDVSDGWCRWPQATIVSGLWLSAERSPEPTTQHQGPPRLQIALPLYSPALLAHLLALPSRQALSSALFAFEPPRFLGK
ncbi:unnamed protein product [Boreogadus saida]